MLRRDARHLALEQVGSDGQQRIAAGTVLLIGAGGIGCASAAYLASSGVGHLIIADFDTVDETNLGRQVLYTPVDVGEQKAEVAAERLRAVNPDIKITAITERLQDAALTIAVESAEGQRCLCRCGATVDLRVRHSPGRATGRLRTRVQQPALLSLSVHGG